MRFRTHETHKCNEMSAVCIYICVQSSLPQNTGKCHLGRDSYPTSFVRVINRYSKLLKKKKLPKMLVKNFWRCFISRENFSLWLKYKFILKKFLGDMCVSNNMTTVFPTFYIVCWIRFITCAKPEKVPQTHTNMTSSKEQGLQWTL